MTPLKTYYVLLRVKIVSTGSGAGRLIPFWWMIDDHDGSGHAVADGEYTIAIRRLDATTYEDALAEFIAQYPLYAPLLDRIEATAPYDWGGRLDAYQHAERMTVWWAARAAALQAGKRPPHVRPPRHDHKPKVGDHIRIGLAVDARVIDISASHGTCYALAFARRDFNADAQRTVWVDEDEILGVIELEESVSFPQTGAPGTRDE